MVADPDLIAAFWEDAKHRARLSKIPGYFGPTPAESVPPPAWTFGATPEQADDLAGLVLSGRKTATSSALWDYQAEGEPLPEIGALGILLDGSDRPRALLRTEEVTVVGFDEVTAEHARLEGEGDRSLDHWRREHRRFFTEHRAHGRDFSPTMPVVLERFRVLYQT